MKEVEPQAGTAPLRLPTARLLRRDRVLDWIRSDTVVDYPEAVAAMDRRVAAIAAGTAPECVWLLEHPPLFTAGTSADDADLGPAPRFPVHRTGRGGQFTYHGPGQRVVYAMLDLGERGRDVRAYVAGLERVVIAALAEFGVVGETRPDRVGVWVRGSPAGEAKIAAIGVRVRRGIAFHGASLNVAPDLSHYADIVPCGIRAFGVTSLADLGVAATMDEVDAALAGGFGRVFGPVRASVLSRP